MSQPIWNTPAGSIGNYTENIALTFTFSATPFTPGNTLIYTLLNGELPESNNINVPFILSSAGVLTGTPAQTDIDVTKSFTIRVLEYSGPAIVGFKDRTFTISITGPTAPQITTSSALGTILDSTWTAIQLSYTNPDNNTDISFRLKSGQLPKGLYVREDGLIFGYAKPPENAVTGAPITQTFNFVIEISGQSGSSATPFTLTVNNQELIPGYIDRAPTILNNRPLSDVIDPTDIYKLYYFTTSSLGNYEQSTDFYFKFIGYDFNFSNISYDFAWVGPSIGTLQFNTITGWLYGTLPTIGATNTTYTFTVRTYNTANPLITSPTITYTITILGNINTEITWLTDSDLGTIINGEISVKNISAVSAGGYSLTYSLSGTLPPDLTFDTTTGDIYGRLAFQSTGSVQYLNQEITYNFSVTAFNVSNPLVTSTKNFTIKTIQKFVKPYENVYIKALLSESDREKWNTLLNNTTIIPNSAIFKPSNPYFGKSSEIIYTHIYGISSTLVDAYLNAININHYWRNLILGDIKSAVAKDNNGNILYEVVYVDVVDDLLNKNGASISKSIVWPVSIPQIPVVDPVLYPNSLTNMKEQISSIIFVTNDAEVLPKWMTTQQNNGSTLGYVPAVVLCYTKPGYSEAIAKNIQKTTLTTSVTASTAADKTFTCDSTANFYVGMVVTFTGTVFGGVVLSTNYYIHSIVSSTKFKIKTAFDSNTAFSPSTASGTMTANQVTWQYTFNELEFRIDRYEVDKSATYEYDPVTETWSSLPSSILNNNSEDYYVYYDQKTIIPNS